MTLHEAWERHATDWIAWARTPGHDYYYWRLNLPAFLGLLPPPGGLTVDVGCGEGRLPRTLTALGHRVIGVERSPTLAQAAAAHAEATAVLLGDGAALPLPDAAADLVVAFMSLHDVDDVQGCVAEIARVLTTGGKFCLAVVHPINSAGTFSSEDEDAPFSIPGSYFATRRYADTVERDGVSMTFTSDHRCLEAYARALEAAGLLVEAVREPRPGADLVVAGPGVAKWQRIPLFLHVRASKPD